MSEVGQAFSKTGTSTGIDDYIELQHDVCCQLHSSGTGVVIDWHVSPCTSRWGEA